jgi:hypothetical protein
MTKIRKKDLPHHSAGYIDGLKAFDAGKKAIPALDENAIAYAKWRDMTPDNVKAYNAYLTGWHKGWHVANVNARD